MKKLTELILCLAALACLAAAVLTATGLFSRGRPAQQTSAPPPEPAEEQQLSPEELAREMMAQMSDEEKVWQMLMLYPEQLIGDCCSTDAERWAEAFEARPAGGVFFASANMPSAEELKNMLSAMGSAADTMPFLALDEEGGSVARLSYTLGVTTDFLPMYEYREEGSSTARSNALTIARDIASFGFNVNLAPVADVWTNPDNKVIGRRAYSHDAAEAAQLVSAAVEGFTEGGVISTLKHFPGHGDTLQDSHYGAATIDKTPEQLRQCEFLPFISGIEAGAGMVMIGHITLTEVDPLLPATLSRKVVEGLLRQELGYDGVVITDAFAMEALNGHDNTVAALMAVEAGCDIILCPNEPDAVAEKLLEHVSMERIEQSVLRILLLKMEYGLI